MIIRFLIVLCFTFLTTSCSSVEKVKGDPFETVNRKIFTFNDSLDQAVLKPVTKAYDRKVPKPVKKGITNFFKNVGIVSTAFNNLLQFKINKLGDDITRFVLNSTVGILGIFDIATKVGIPYNNEDFGQTLGYWGIKSGPYLMLPFLGPSTLRDSSNFFVGFKVDPTFSDISSDKLKYTSLGLRIIDKRRSLLPADNILELQYDRYAFIRNTYMQSRLNKINDDLNPVKNRNLMEKPKKSLLELEAEEFGDESIFNEQ